MSRTPPGFAESGQTPLSPPPFTTLPDPALRAFVEVPKSGRIVIPAAMRAAMGVKEGDRVMLLVEDGVLTVESHARVIAKIQAKIRALVPPGVSLVDELIADRRREAASEWDEAVLGPLPPALQGYK